MNKKKRGPNWTAEEKAILLKEYSKRRAILECRVNSDMSKLGKLQQWEEIVARVNAVNPLIRRSIFDTKKKLLNIAYSARNHPRLRHALRIRASAPPPPPPLTQFSEVHFLSLPTACPQETASTPASLALSAPEHTPVDQPTPAPPPPPPPPVSPTPESSRTHNGPRELEGQGGDGGFERLHAAVSDCGDRIVAALGPIADSFQQLTRRVGALVEVLAEQAQARRPPCRHACPTCSCPQEQVYSPEAVHQLKSEVKQFSWQR